MATPTSELGQTLARVAVRLLELGAWRDSEICPIAEVQFRADKGSIWKQIRPGDSWPQKATPVWLKFDTSIPSNWNGAPVYSRFAVGGEALLSVNGQVLGGLNLFHREHTVSTAARGGEKLVFEAEVVPHGLFGTPSPDPRLEEACLLIPDLVVRALYEDLAAALDAANYLRSVGRDDVSQRLSDALQRAFMRLPLPRDRTADYLARLASTSRDRSLQDFYGNKESLASLWEDYTFDLPGPQLSAEARDALAAIRKSFGVELEQIRELYPSIGTIWLTGHAHIDLAWLWPLEETRRKARRTFHTVAGLMDRYPNFSFNQSSAQAYAWIEEDDQALFEKIRNRVAEGRWEIIGGMWVEPDGNLPAGESWVRQLLFGQRFFQTKFGKRPRVAWLPDSFGFTGNLPQLLRSAGLPFFFTHKLTWNERNEFPYDLYWWEGIDGTRVLAHSFNNPDHGYNGQIVARDLGETWRNFKGKRHHDVTLLAFGYGDGGGGPTTEMLERFDRLKKFPGMPRLAMGRVEDFYERIDGNSLPVWTGEQYFEYHRATFTTQAKVKSLHRRLECAVAECEVAATLALIHRALPYPKADLEQIWRTLLLNEFHDILPGSSIHTVYETAQQQLGEALSRAEKLRDEALGTLSGRPVQMNFRPSDPLGLTIWNFQLHDRPLALELPRPIENDFKLITAEGSEVPYQTAGDGKILVVSPAVSVPPLGSVSLAIELGAPSGISPAVRGSPSELENDLIKVSVNPDGSLSSLYDKETGREVLSDRGNQLWIFTDIPRQFDAWDIDASYTQEGFELLADQAHQLVESGPLRATLRVIRKFGSSKIVQNYSLTHGSRQLLIRTKARWHGRRRLLRALFPLRIRSHEFWTETAFGAVPRPTHRNTTWDQAKFEVPGHRWADLSEPDYGVSVLTDSKYGYSAQQNVLAVTLLRSSIYPDPYADEGEHEFAYSLYPHPGDWRRGTIQAAQALTAPLQAMFTNSIPVSPANAEWRLSGGTLELACLKQAEDSSDLILRLYEPHGNRGVATLKAGRPLRAASLVNVLEETLAPLPFTSDSRVQIEFTPFQVVTLRLALK
ncbi:MAG: alpha-mannosidase [Chthoniobacterales bacterium]